MMRTQARQTPAIAAAREVCGRRAAGRAGLAGRARVADRGAWCPWSAEPPM